MALVCRYCYGIYNEENVVNDICPNSRCLGIKLHQVHDSIADVISKFYNLGMILEHVNFGNIHDEVFLCTIVIRFRDFHKSNDFYYIAQDIGYLYHRPEVIKRDYYIVEIRDYRDLMQNLLKENIALDRLKIQYNFLWFLYNLYYQLGER